MSDEINPKYAALSEFLKEQALNLVFEPEDQVKPVMMAALARYSGEVAPLTDWAVFHDELQDGNMFIDVAVKFEGEEFFVYIPVTITKVTNG